MSDKKILSLEGLGIYDAKVKAFIEDKRDYKVKILDAEGMGKIIYAYRGKDPAEITYTSTAVEDETPFPYYFGWIMALSMLPKEQAEVACLFNLESGTVADLDFYILDTIGVQQAHFFMPGNYLCFQGTFNRVIMEDIENPVMLPETVSYNIMWQKQGDIFSPFYFDRYNVSSSVVAKELVFDEGKYDYTYKKDDLIMFLGEDDLLGVGGLFSPDLTESLMGTGVYEGLFCEIYTVIEKTGLATLTAELKVPAGESIIYKTISAWDKF